VWGAILLMRRDVLRRMERGELPAQRAAQQAAQQAARDADDGKPPA
jgi:hypothetical protein